jgi:hypothetical protein
VMAEHKDVVSETLRTMVAGHDRLLFSMIPKG